ncbi:MAG TPA: 50S ribosomal protein L9 [Candidatus Paceibacterota bacterium]|nr:50S ribosomal protein L9 [Candidatus Paceibacterota bacterium]
MKVILIRDVARLGRKSEVKDVPSGHAQNFLIPRKLAIPATPENVRRLGEAMKKNAAAEAERMETFRAALAACAAKPVTIEAEANEQGHLFKGLHAKDVVHALAAAGCEFDESDIVLSAPIKSIGTHTVALERGDEKGSATLEVVKK